MADFLRAQDAVKMLPPTLELYFTNKCNLDCEYCSSRLMKCGAPKTLSFEEIMRAVELTAQYSIRKDGPALTVGLTGGEPLLEFELVKRVIGRIKRRHRRLNLHLCTNGTLLDREKAEFLLDNGVELDLSLDGDKPAHDRNKKFSRGGELSVFEAVIANLAKLPRSCLDRIRAVATFDSGTVSFITDSMDFLDGVGFKSTGFGLDIYELWPRKKIAVLAEALGRFRDYYLKIYKEAFRGDPARPARFPFENKLGAAQSELVSNEFSLSVDGYFFPSDTVCRGKGGAGCTIGDLKSGIDFEKLKKTYSRLSKIISRYEYPNSILPAVDRYYYAIFNNINPEIFLENGRAVSRAFEEKLGGLMYAKKLIEELLRDKSFGDFSHRPKYAANKPIKCFEAGSSDEISGTRKTLDYFFYSSSSGKQLTLEAPGFSDKNGKIMLYSLIKAEQLARPVKILLQKSQKIVTTQVPRILPSPWRERAG